MKSKTISNGWKKYDYFEWLVTKVNCPKSENHTRLLHLFYSTKFLCVLERDMNRVKDGLMLRKRFYNSGQSIISDDLVPVIDPEHSDCTLLEVMVAMAERFCFDVVGFGFKTTADYFWFMVENLGLNKATDDNFDENYVYSIIEKMMNRNYKADGRGGMFPLLHPSMDQRKVELWNQLSEWYDERYGDMPYDEG